MGERTLPALHSVSRLVAANNGRGFACVADAVGMGGANRVPARASQFMDDMMMKSSLRPIDRNLSVASICGSSDGIAVFQPGICAHRWRSDDKGGDQPCCDQQSVHDTHPPFASWLSGQPLPFYD